MQDLERIRILILKGAWRKLIFLVITLILVLVNFVFAQFGKDIIVSDTTGGDFGCIEPWITQGSDGTLYTIWTSDYSSGWDFHIYFSKSADSGITWTPCIGVDDSPAPGSCLFPCISVDSFSNLYCVWSDFWPTVGYCIRFSKSTDGGATWTPSVRVDDGPYGQITERSEITVNGDKLWVVWEGTQGIRFSKSTDGGNTWSPSFQVTSINFSRMKTRSDTIYVVHYMSDIYLSRSTDRGLTWEEMGRINDVGSGDQKFAGFDLTPGGTLCCAWYDWRSGDCEIRFSKSTDGGGSWIPSVVVSDTTWTQNPTWGEIKMEVVCLDGDRIFCVWQDARYGDIGPFNGWDIFFAMSEDGGNSWSENVFIPDTGLGTGVTQMCPSVYIGEGEDLFVVWEDNRDWGGGQAPCYIYFDKGKFTGVKELTISWSEKPYVVLEAYPNPFRFKTELTFSIGQSAEDIELKIFDLNGRLVKSFTLTTDHSALSTVVSWDGRDNSGKEVQSGVYFIRLNVGGCHSTKKLLRLP